MKKEVLVPIADGTEEMEAAIVIDLLRRANISVTVASVENQKTVQASRKLKLEADTFISDCLNTPWAAIVLPGGMPGAQHLSECEALITLLKKQFAGQRLVAAICAAPAKILGAHNFIYCYKATGYPETFDELSAQASEVIDQPVVIDNTLITSQGPGTAFAFGLSIIEKLEGQAVAQNVAQAALIPWPMP